MADLHRRREEVGMICPDCEGKGTAIALVDRAHYRGPMCVSCSRCKGTGETDPADRVLVGDRRHASDAGRAVSVGERPR